MCSFHQDITLGLDGWDWYKLLETINAPSAFPNIDWFTGFQSREKSMLQILVWFHKIPGSSSSSFTVSLKTFKKSFNLPDFYCLL